MNIRELYQEVILEHSRNPRNFGALEGATCHANGHNPLCGDKLVLNLKVAGDKVMDASFDGSGCAISMASASLMTEFLKGKTVAEADAMFQRFHGLLTGNAEVDDEALAALGKLAVLAGVRDFPVRVKCATLAWHTLEAALHNADERVSTE